jgi:hypothetical protein
MSTERQIQIACVARGCYEHGMERERSRTNGVLLPYLQFRAEPEEKKLIEEAARRDDYKTTAEWMRRTLLREARKILARA